MELPKNVTQIGETNHSCKIYVEDYVISYIKQLNGHAMDKELAVGLYGVRREEAGITYLFLYGAGKLNFLQREARHLSQAVLQEADKLQKKYFGEYVFLGYCLLNGEMVEGFYVYEQGVCRYIKGYAQFYEKNDSMLQFMLEERQEEAKPEEFDQEKYDAVKRRQEERRSVAEAQGQRHRSIYRKKEAAGKGSNSQLRQMRMTAAAVFVLLCGAGLAAMDGGQRLEEFRAVISNMVAGASKKQLPDATEVSNGTAQVGTIVTEDRLTEAIRQENQNAADEGQNAPAQGSENKADGEDSPAGPASSEPAESGESTPPESTPSGVGDSGESEPSEPLPSEAQETGESAPPESAETEPSEAPEPVSYTVKRGDTLIGICLARYGSDSRVAEICELNHIKNPDNIKIGQKILLPQ